MPWRHEGRMVRITQDIDLGAHGGLVRRGERGVVTYANRKEDIFDIKLDREHPGLENNLLYVQPYDDSVGPYLERDRLSEAVRFVRHHGAVMATGGFLVGILAPVTSPLVYAMPRTMTTRLLEYEGKLYRVTEAITAEGTIDAITSIVPVMADELPQVDADTLPNTAALE